MLLLTYRTLAAFAKAFCAVLMLVYALAHVHLFIPDVQAQQQPDLLPALLKFRRNHFRLSYMSIWSGCMSGHTQVPAQLVPLLCEKGS